jgi:hypothetical protein
VQGSEPPRGRVVSRSRSSADGGRRRRLWRACGRALSLGLIDHVAIDIVPVVFGRGKPYFGTFGDRHLMLGDPQVVIQGHVGVLHLRYPVHRRRSMPPPIVPDGDR